MDVLEAMKARRSVRAYNDKKISVETASELRSAIDAANKESGLHIQLCLDEPNAFSGRMARYGKFSGVRNYIAMVGRNSKDLNERVGYYGEKIVLKATELGLGTCWVAMTYSKSIGKSSCEIGRGEKLVIVVSLGYFDKAGAPRKTKSIEELSRADSMPDWFRRGMEAVQLAPTAMNQQKFLFSCDGNAVTAKAGAGFYTRLDLGIAKYHFELGAGDAGWEWAAQ